MTGFARDWGQGDPALLLHCSLAHSGAWEGVARRLSDRLHMIAPDLVGHGRGPALDPQRDIHDQSTEAARAHLPDAPCHLIGHSFGATVALRLAIEDPARARSLTLIEPVLFAAAEGQPEAEVYDAALADLPKLLAEGQDRAAADLFLSIWGSGEALDDMPPAQARDMADRIGLVDAATPALHHDRAGLLGRLDRVTCPVLLLEGSDSPPVIAEIQDTLASRLPDTRRAVIDGAGHMLPITHPEAVAAAIGVFIP